MIELCTKVKISTFTHYEDMKGDEKCRNWDGLGDYGSLKVIGNIAIMLPFDKVHTLPHRL